jgi:hypothetical protein
MTLVEFAALIDDPSDLRSRLWRGERSRLLLFFFSAEMRSSSDIVNLASGILADIAKKAGINFCDITLSTKVTRHLTHILIILTSWCTFLGFEVRKRPQ